MKEAITEIIKRRSTTTTPISLAIPLTNLSYDEVLKKIKSGEIRIANTTKPIRVYTEDIFNLIKSTNKSN